MKRHQKIGKCVPVGIILLFVGTSIIPSIAQVTEKPGVPSFVGEWLYVGGSGPGNYSNITTALRNATDGDTIYVYSGIYTEDVNFLEINVSISLIGESNLSTIINHTSFWFNTSNIFLTGFWFQNSSTIYIASIYGNEVSHNSVTNSIFTNLSSGIMIENSSYNTIVNNQFYQCGIFLGAYLTFYLYPFAPEYDDSTNTIFDNMVNGKPLVYREDDHDQTISDAGEIILLRCSNITITHTNFGSVLSLIELIQTTDVKVTDNDFNNTIIALFNSSENTIAENRFSPISDGSQLNGLVLFGPSTGNDITNNVFSHESTIFIFNSSHNLFKRNDFYGSQFRFSGPLILFMDADNTWQRNYWMRPRILPKIILGAKSSSAPSKLSQISLDVDWRPTLKPNNPKPEWVYDDMQIERKMSYPWITTMSFLHLNPSYWRSTIPQAFR